MHSVLTLKLGVTGVERRGNGGEWAIARGGRRGGELISTVLLHDAVAHGRLAGGWSGCGRGKKLDRLGLWSLSCGYYCVLMCHMLLMWSTYMSKEFLLGQFLISPSKNLWFLIHP
jgi:hypothetical protein